MARGRTRWFALLAWVALAGATACMTDHDALQKRPTPTPSSGGGGGSASAAAGSGGRALTSGSGNSSAGSGHSDDEAPGTSVLTLLHGVVDAPSIALCLAKVTVDGVVPFGDPLSDTPLAYGQSLVLPSISGADAASDTLELFVIAGDLELVAGLDCASAIARARAEEAAANPLPEPQGAAGAGGAPDSSGGGFDIPGAAGASDNGGAGGAPSEVRAPLRVRSLPAIPPGTLNGGRSYLLVAAGCLGGAGYTAPHAEDYCGAGYTEHNPTATLIFAALSRASAAGHVGLQLLHASLATDPISVSSVAARPATDSPISIAAGDPEGGLAPRPAYIDHTAFDYGTTRHFGLEVHATREVPQKTQSQDVTLFTEEWADVLTSGGTPELVDGSNYALVLIGPLADSMPGAAFWNRPAITVVPADPK